MASLERSKARRNGRLFVQLFRDVLDHPNYIKLTPRAVKLFNDLLSQYNGSNNGDLSACMALMEKRGWSSKSNLGLALKELLYYEFVIVSRQGGRKQPTLLAMTCYPIDECKGKHDLRATTAANHNYKLTKKKWNPKRGPQQNAYPTGGGAYPTDGSINRPDSPISPQVGQLNG